VCLGATSTGDTLATQKPGLDKQRWELAVTIFENALEADTGAREAYIASSANGDAEIIAAVLGMLAADDTDERLLDQGLDELAHVAFDGWPGHEVAPGTSIGDFEIIEEIGHGGMGVVYAARDRKLGRIAALKLLPPHSRGDSAASDRLIEEAQAASRLDHPNVATIYQVGETTDGRRFIAMARYEGETLRQRLARGPIPPRDSFRIAKQIADGLAVAHAAGLVHRDVKPENIFITTRGIAKLLDFGIATAAGSSDGPVTRGTILYLSPEQILERGASPRSDVWSLGVALYEMLDGSAPFSGSNTQQILKSISEPSPVKPPAISRRIPALAISALTKALEKNPAARFADASEMAAHLDRAIAGWTRSRKLGIGLGAAAAVTAVTAITLWILTGHELRPGTIAEIPEIAVMPVVGAATDSESIHLATALGDEIAARVVGLKRVRLVSAPAPNDAARHPGLHLLRLGISHIGAQPSVDVTLARADNNESEFRTRREFDRARLREIGRDVVVGVLQAMGQPISDRERAAIGSSFPSSAAAYEEFLEANRLLAVRTPAAVESAVMHYRNASRLDTMFASALARQSYSYSLLVDWGWKPTKAFPGDALAEAERLANRATSLDSISADGWLAHAYTLVLRDPARMEGSLQAFQRAISLDPYNAEAFHQYGQTLMALGRYAEALAAYRRVLDLEPDRAMTLVPMAAIHERQHDLSEGLRLLDSAISAAPRVPYARATRALFRAESGDGRGAIADARFALELDPNFRVPALSALAKGQAALGDTAAAIRTVLEAEQEIANLSAPTYTEAFWVGLAETATGRYREAADLLTKTRPHGAILWFMFQSTDFDKLRTMPRVAEFLGSIDPRRPVQ
jgi:serine/threonine-protein kinase